MSSTNPENRFHLQGIYPCPICYRGEISSIPLMDAFGCNFCNHIFTAEVDEQLLKMADSQPSLAWRWQDKTWKNLQRESLELGWAYVVAGIMFVLFPPTVVGLSAYLIPPMPGSPLPWFPIFWTGLVFVSHLACLLWLVIGYYQFPFFLYFRAMRRGLLSRRGF